MTQNQIKGLMAGAIEEYKQHLAKHMQDMDHMLSRFNKAVDARSEEASMIANSMLTTIVQLPIRARLDTIARYGVLADRASREVEA